MAKISKVQFLKLQKKHVTDARVGTALGITRQAVHQLRKKWGIESTTTDHSERNAKIVKAYVSGESGTSIAKKLGLSISQTYRVINAAVGKARTAEQRAVAKVVKKTTAKKAPAKKGSVKKKK